MEFVNYQQLKEANDANDEEFLNNVQYVAFEDNEVNDDHHYTEIFRKTPNIKYIDFGYNITHRHIPVGFPNTVVFMCKDENLHNLPNMPKLEKLIIPHCRMDRNDFWHIVVNDNHIKEMDVSYNYLDTIRISNAMISVKATDNRLHTIQPLVPVLNHLNRLNLAHNNLTSFDFSLFPNIKYLNLEKNYISGSITIENKSLTDLNIAENKITEINLQKATSLEKLDLNNCKITNIFLDNDEKIDYIDLSKNYLQNFHCNNPTVLNLSFNFNLNSFTIKSNDSIIKELYLSHTSITELQNNIKDVEILHIDFTKVTKLGNSYRSVKELLIQYSLIKDIKLNLFKNLTTLDIDGIPAFDSNNNIIIGSRTVTII